MVNILGIETSCDETGVAVIHGENFQFFPSWGSAAAEISNFQTCKEDIIKNDQNAGAQNLVPNDIDENFDFKILAEGLASSVDLQKEYGGVVPELASRVHVEKINLLLARCLNDAHLNWSDIDAIAIANGPGLVGSLLVGTMVAKTLGMVLGKPLISVNHLEGHICSSFLVKNEENFQFFLSRGSAGAEIFNFQTCNEKIDNKNQKDTVGAGRDLPGFDRKNIFPMLVLIVSGGHTELLIMKDIGKYEMLGSTMDDAAGEAFDKAAKILGLEYPGGPSISRRAAKCNFQFFPSRGSAGAEISNFQTNNVGTQNLVSIDKDFFKLPRPLLDRDDYDFSFSGLKTALLYKWKEISNLRTKNEGENLREELVNRMAWEFQEAVVDVLVTKTVRAAEKFDIDKVAIVGGVAANARLREEMEIRLQKVGRKLIVPPIKYCTDNGVKIAVAGYFKYLQDDLTDWKKLEVRSNWEL